MKKALAGLAAALLLIGAAPPGAGTLRSAFPAVKAVPVTDLPAAPRSPDRDADCLERLGTAPKTPGGRLAARHGWHVLGERTVAGTTAVVIASGARAGTSGMCLVENGNIALFRGGRPIGVFYSREPGGSVANGFGPLLGDRLRVRNVASIYADLVFATDRVTLAKPGPQGHVCGTDAAVPAILDRLMSTARPELLAAGWKPVAYSEPGRAGASIANDLWKKGWKEAAPCAGSGLGYCGFHYRQRRIDLWVLTIGERTQVSDYRLACHER